MDSEPCKTSKIKHFTKIVNGWKLLTIFAKSFLLTVWQCCKDVPGIDSLVKISQLLCTIWVILRVTFMGICISRPVALFWPPALALAPGPQFVFTSPGPQFVFTGPGPQFAFNTPGLGFVFTSPGKLLFVFTGPGLLFVIYQFRSRFYYYYRSYLYYHYYYNHHHHYYWY